MNSPILDCREPTNGDLDASRPGVVVLQSRCEAAHRPRSRSRSSNKNDLRGLSRGSRGEATRIKAWCQEGSCYNMKQRSTAPIPDTRGTYNSYFCFSEGNVR